MLIHICGHCQTAFTTEAAYLNHVCSASGSTPRQSQSHPPHPKNKKLAEKKVLAAVRAVRRRKKV